MGGNALKNCHTRRYLAEEYHLIYSEVYSYLKGIFPNTKINTIKSYSSKESFGDLDVLISSAQLPSNWIDLIVNKFNPKEWIKNGKVISFEYKEFQIDLIVTDPSEMQSSIDYFAFNDASNLMGRIAHSMGLKLGHDGLSYNWRIDTYQFKNVVLLTDFEDILPVLGYSYERYRQGFETLEDIFEFVVSSPFFTPDIFLLQNRNHISRVRDAKRLTYMKFLEWIKVPSNIPVNEVQYIHKDKKEWLPYLFYSINGFKETYEEVQSEWDNEVRFKSLYNGDIVREYTGLEGKQLGNFMKWFREYYGVAYIRKDILAINSTLIPGWIKYFKGKYDKQTANVYTKEELDAVADI